MNKFKQYMPYILMAVIGVIVLGFGKKIMQMFGLADSDAESLAKNQQKEVIKALVNEKPDETKLIHPVSYYVDLASSCYHMNHDFFDGDASKKVMAVLPGLNVEEIRQLCRSYIQFSSTATLWQDVVSKWGSWYVNILGTSAQYTAFEAALSRANLKI